MKNEVFIKYIHRIDESEELSEEHKLRAYYRLFVLILEELSDEDKVHFTSLFSRITYVGSVHRISGSMLFLLHALRRGIENELTTAENQKHFLDLARYNCVALINHVGQLNLSQKISESEIYHFFQPANEDFQAFHSVLEGVVVSYDIDAKAFGFIEQDNGVDIWTIRYDVPHKNEIFTSNLHSLFENIEFPCAINLIDVEELDGSIFIPKAIVIEPDYMVDVTAIANAFKYYGTEPLEYILNKFRPQEMSVHLLVGNVANNLLDELINQPEADFRSLLPKIFNSNPLTFSCLTDHAVKDVVSTIKKHFYHLKNVIEVEFSKEDIHTKDAYLEPAYYSRTFGIQGRLDLLHEHRQHKHFDIVELKSGSPFMPNNYGLSVQHYTQTLLYDLIIKSAYLGKKKTSNYILYSKETDWNLRNAPVMKVQQYEALKVRNELVLLDQELLKLNLHQKLNILARINLSSFPKAKGFSKKHVEVFSNVYKSLTSLEKIYFQAYSGFIALEHRLAKIGEHGLSKSNGLAAMWLEGKEEKKERFSILDGLEIIENLSDQLTPTITLKKSELSVDLTKFRKGDIVVLYPDHGVRAVLRNQIFKCSIIELIDDQVKLKLRSQQYNHQIFRTYRYWAIEGDVMDSSFLSMYRNLYQWAQAPQKVRNLLLGMDPPKEFRTSYDYHSSELTDEQNLLLNRMVASEDFYLLWGPPGTGKTSVMIKELIRYLFYHTQEKILLIAYTNKAVDELCAAVLSALSDEQFPFIRVGSSHAANEQYVPYLLDQSLRQFTTRNEIIDFLKKHRVIISTLASIQNRIELFHLFQFDTLIIDEASQILEPMLVGLLPRFRRWMMIGDHKQLPAVVVQDPADSKIRHEDLQKLGIVDTRMSLFERIFHQCKAKGWSHAYGILTAQGRMHRDLMQFSNKYFYENRLQVIPNVGRLVSLGLFDRDDYHSQFGLNRFIYIATETDKLFSWKTNDSEATIAVKIIRQLIKELQLNDIPWTKESIGIITPYRAQIALITSLLTEEELVKITVDTVERYQGGARDIIILSLCTNRQDQLEKLVSLSDEGIDRKLNVALTRARERIFVLGNEDILQSDVMYHNLIRDAHSIKYN